MGASENSLLLTELVDSIHGKEDEIVREKASIDKDALFKKFKGEQEKCYGEFQSHMVLAFSLFGKSA